MPQTIIVGVDNIDRNHDFLPDSTKEAPTGGGADNFMRFFSSELMPFIDRKFKTEPYKVLVGHSYGGLFAVHVLLNEPDLFDAYIAIDPSIWYDKMKILQSAENEFPKSKNWNRLIFITGREGEGMKEMGIVPLETLLKKAAPKDLSWKIAAYPNEDHGSVTFKSAYDGLRYIFDAGANLSIFPQKGIIPPGRPVYVFLGNINPSLRYTTDGTDPTASSPAVTEKIKITGPCTLKIKSVDKKYKAPPMATYVFTKGDYLTGIKTSEYLKPGLEYSYYEVGVGFTSRLFKA